MKNFKVKFVKSQNAGSFTTGARISQNDWRQLSHWKGADEIRKGRKNTYLVVAASDGGALCDFIFQVLDAPQGMDISGLNFHDTFDRPDWSVDEFTVTFSSTPS